MKTKRKIFTVIVAVILSAIIAAFAASASTPENTGTDVPEIKANSLSLKETVYVLYAVDFGSIPSGAEYGMLVWEAEEGTTLPEKFTHENAASAVDLKSAGWKDVNGVRCEIFTYSGLAAKQMTDYLYSVAYIKNPGDSEYTYSALSKYSILQYTIGSALKDSNRNLLSALREYGARAQEYFKYRTDRLANEEYVLATITDGVLEDGTSIGFFKPGEEIQATATANTFVSGTKVNWYVSSEDGTNTLYENTGFSAPTANFTARAAVIINEETFDTAKHNANGYCTAAGIYYHSNKGASRYYLVSDGNGGQYIEHHKAAGSGNDSQVDSTQKKFNMQQHFYNAATSTFADKKLTVTIKLARTEDDVADAKFNLRHYPKYFDADGNKVSGAKSDFTTNVFRVYPDGRVSLGDKTDIGYLSTEWQEFSFVIDFGAGDTPEANNLFAYRNGFLLGAIRLDNFNTENFLVHTDNTECMIVNFHSPTQEADGVLLYDDIRLILGSSPVNSEKKGIVNYELNGGSLSVTEEPSYNIGELKTLPVPTKENYKFAGWYTTSTFDEGTKVESFTEYEHKVITLYAKFESESEYIDSLKATNNAFSNEDFYRVDTDNEYNLDASEGGVKEDHYPLVEYGQSVTVDRIITMDTSKYEPPATPSGKQHPYLFFSKDQIAKIKETLNSPEFSATAVKFWSLANAEGFTGEFPQWKEAVKDNGPERWSTDIHATMEAKAFAYLITGDASYGYQAIIGAKNAMLTLVYSQRIHSDPYHGASQTVVTVAKVYDWCYDLLTENDKKQIILGVQNLMCPTLEFNFFQKEQGLSESDPKLSAVNGHSTGPQFLRDYVTVALAFYNEAPSWWDFIGGRYIEEYAPVIDYVYQGGWASQGTSTYGTSKCFVNMWAAWVTRSSTGYTVSYAVDDGGSGREAAYFINSHIMANDRYFSTGDGARTANGSAINIEYMVISAAFYQDPALEAFAKYYTNGYSKWTYNFTEEMTAPMTLVYGSFFAEDVPEGEYENRGDGVDLIQYFSYPNGFISARDSWESDAAVVIMKIGEMTMANHDIGDHGTFQIYYKGLLATSSGAYNKYGSNVHNYYLQATIGQNGLLIFNPAFADDEPAYNANGKVTNGYYYSGSQKELEAGTTFKEFTDGRAKMGTVYGHDVAYYDDGSAKHAYIAGDITSAYDKATVDYVGRRMLTIYTGDPNYPMLFFTFDQMTSDSASFKKTFLLHTVKEPEIDEDAKRAVITEGEGRLVLQSLSGAKSITKIGGKGYAYWINGKNCLDEYTDSDNYDEIWGRIELNTDGNLYDSLLTAMYVTDSTNDEILEAVGYEAEDVKFATIADYVVVFADTTTPLSKEISIDVQGTGDRKYYVSGLSAGEWTVTVDGVIIADVTVSEESGLATFTAPAGTVKISPKSNVVGNGI